MFGIVDVLDVVENLCRDKWFDRTIIAVIDPTRPRGTRFRPRSSNEGCRITKYGVHQSPSALTSNRNARDKEEMT